MQRSTQSPSQTLRHLQPEDTRHPVVVCDSWAQYHGSPGSWSKKFKENVPPPLNSIDWDTIAAHDVSIPPFKGLNSKQREYFTQKTQEIIAPVMSRKAKV
jgi:hypothetical protein